ncbi:MAG: hypothetical protein JXA94_05955 [Parachlamydiales bacterium]|nr:hypothetical protein [Parachlamydiales bacterium]
MKYIGIDYTDDIFYIARLDENNAILSLENLDSKNQKNVKQLYILDKEKILISTGLDASDVVIKNTDFHVKKSLFMKNAYDFQKESLTTLDPEKTISIQNHINEKSLLQFFITTKDLVKKHLRKFNHFQIDPDFISASAVALKRFAKLYTAEKNIFIVNIQKSKITFVLIKDDIIEKSFAIKNGHVDKSVTENDIIKIFESFNQNPKDVFNLLLCGEENFKSSFSHLKAHKNISIFLTNNELEKKLPEIQKYAISIGLALEPSQPDKDQINFRTKEFTTIKVLKNRVRKIKTFALVCILLSILLILFTNISVFKKEKKLRKNLENLSIYEKKYLDSNQNLLFKDIHKDIAGYESRLNNQTKKFPYFFTAYQVTDVLNWVNTHPYLKNAEIKSFTYEMQSYPTLEAKAQPYLVKIDLEFQTANSKEARGFYSDLQKQKALIDQSKEILWESFNDTYKTTFYLKNKKT